MPLHLSYARIRRGIPTVLQEMSLLVMWLMATPIISNYIAVKRVFDPIWYTCIALGHLFRWWLIASRRQPPPLCRWLYQVPFVPLLLLWGFILGGEIRLIRASYPLLLLLLGGLVGYLHGARRLHGWPLALLFGALIVLTLYDQFFTLTAIYLALAVLFILGGVLWRRAVYHVPAWVAAFALMNPFVVFVLYHFRFVNGTQLARVSTHPAVERLFLYSASDPIGRMMGKNIMTIQEGCTPDTYLVATHHGKMGVVLVDRKHHLVRGYPQLREGSNDILLDCARGEAVVGAFSDPAGLYFIDLRNGPTLTRPMIPIPGRGVVYIIFDQIHNQYLVFPKDQVLYAVDARTGHLTAALRGPDERAYDPARDQLTSLTEPDFSIMRIGIGDPKQNPLRVLNRRSMHIPLNQRLQMYFHPGLVAGTTLVTNLWKGTLTLYDRHLLPIRQRRIAPGVSGIALTRDQRFILVGGYTDGNLYFLDAVTWKIVAHLYLGHRMRELRLSRNGRYVYVGTSQGGFRVDIARVLDTPSAS